MYGDSVSQVWFHWHPLLNCCTIQYISPSLVPLAYIFLPCTLLPLPLSSRFSSLPFSSSLSSFSRSLLLRSFPLNFFFLPQFLSLRPLLHNLLVNKANSAPLPSTPPYCAPNGAFIIVVPMVPLLFGTQVCHLTDIKICSRCSGWS